MAGGEALKTVEFQSVAGGDLVPRPHLSVVPSIQLDRTRDDLLTDFGKKTLEDRYLLPGERKCVDANPAERCGRLLPDDGPVSSRGGVVRQGLIMRPTIADSLSATTNSAARALISVLAIRHTRRANGVIGDKIIGR